MKGNAKSIDAIAIMHEQHKVHDRVDMLADGLAIMWSELNFDSSRNPWADTKKYCSLPGKHIENWKDPSSLYAKSGSRISSVMADAVGDCFQDGDGKVTRSEWQLLLAGQCSQPLDQLRNTLMQ